MCIRDRLLTPYLDIPFQHASPSVLKRMKRPANEAKVLERLKNWRAIAPDISIPVSYTHLDVYKRQSLDRLASGGRGLRIYRGGKPYGFWEEETNILQAGDTIVEVINCETCEAD